MGRLFSYCLLIVIMCDVFDLMFCVVRVVFCGLFGLLFVVSLFCCLDVSDLFGVGFWLGWFVCLTCSLCC